MSSETLISYFYKSGKYLDLANYLIHTSGIHRFLDIDLMEKSPEKFCQTLGLSYLLENTHSGGCIDGSYDSSAKTICVYHSGNPQRDLFTLGHEVGHFILHTHEEWNLKSAEFVQSSDRREVEEKLPTILHLKYFCLQSNIVFQILMKKSLQTLSVKIL